MPTRKIHTFDADPEQILACIDKLEGAFIWSTSPQGHRYWSEIRDELRELVELAREG